MRSRRPETCALLAAVFMAWLPSSCRSHADELTQAFRQDALPVLEKYCYDCHGNGEREGTVALDSLDADVINGTDAESWHGVLDVLNTGDMPPEGEAQPTPAERRLLVDWMTEALKQAAAARQQEKTVALRRLTTEQYSNTLSQLLSLPIRFGDRLPDDGKSKMGFSNNGDVLQISPLHIEYYRAIANEALDKAIVTGDRPNPIRYRVEFGSEIGEGQPSAEFVGYQTMPLSSNDFRVHVLDANGESVEPANRTVELAMRGLKNKIGVGLRGSTADRFGAIEDGIVLYSALPHRNVPPRSWQGPSPNLKVVIKDNFPRAGAVRFNAKVSRGPLLETKRGLISLRDENPAKESASSIRLSAKNHKSNVNLEFVEGVGLRPVNLADNTSTRMTLEIPTTGYYQFDLVHPYAPNDSMPSFLLSINKIGTIQERLYLNKLLKDNQRIVTPVSLALLEQGEYSLKLGGKFFVGFSELIVTPLPGNDTISRSLTNEMAANQQKYGSKNPSVRVFAGTRTDDGMDFATFGAAQEVTAPPGQMQTLEFIGCLENLPIPVFDPDATTIHANTMVIGLWNDYLVKQKSDSGPPLLVHSVELEAPYYEQWPPKSHTDIFFDSPNRDDLEIYTREVLTRFIERSYRRPVSASELERYVDFWKDIRGEHERYEDGIKQVLVAVICNPNFLFLAGMPKTDDIQNLEQFSLASRLSYFLWNSPPDDELLRLANEGHLTDDLENQIDRMIADPKVRRMVRAFTYEWLRVDRQQLMDTNTRAYPDFTRFVKEDMPKETYHFVHHVLANDQSILNFIQSDFAMLNQNLAEFYGVSGVEGSYFRPVEIQPASHRGGLLAQGAFLNGHSDGVEPHPIKRAVWLKEKILGDPAPPPPPNVPELDPDTPGFDKLTLKEQLELHRSKASCVDCHKKIDPYGIVFEQFDAVGRVRTQAKGKPVDAVSSLPDGKVVNGVEGIQQYILNNRADDVTRSLVEHMFAYALGRDVTFADEDEIQRIVDQVTADSYRFRSVIKGIVLSQSFLDD